MIDRRSFVLGAAGLGSVSGFAAEQAATGGISAADMPGEFDVVVLGGSCTGVFAALKAAEGGAKVALVEMSGGFGGTATQGLVPVWHSLYSTDGREQVIGGLTEAVEQELLRRGEARMDRPDNPAVGMHLNVAGLQLLLDELVVKSGRIVPFLHTRLAAAECDRPGHVSAAIVADKSGLRRLRGKFFIDATGDADLCRYAGLATWKLPKDQMQAHTVCAIISGVGDIWRKYPSFRLGEIVKPKYGAKLDHVFGWEAPVIGADGLMFLAYTRVSSCDPSLPDDLTRAELEGRAQLRRIVDAVNRAFPLPDGKGLAVVTVAPHVGLRESCHIEGLYRLTTEELLYGRRFDDVIAKGSYRVDIHEGAGITFRYLNGREERQVVKPDGSSEWKVGRWRKETENLPTWYEIPYRSIVPKGAENVLAPGRALDCARDAYGASRVMVNCNQMGEAAGRAAANALRRDLKAAEAYAG